MFSHFVETELGMTGLGSMGRTMEKSLEYSRGAMQMGESENCVVIDLLKYAKRWE